jgi:hypothetical protein
VTEDEREEMLTTLHSLGRSIEQGSEERDVATAACLYGLCLAIREGAEVELARHILMLDGDADSELVTAPLSKGDAQGN